jgi:hypothetical protein
MLSATVTESISFADYWRDPRCQSKKGNPPKGAQPGNLVVAFAGRTLRAHPDAIIWAGALQNNGQPFAHTGVVPDMGDELLSARYALKGAVG